MAYDGNALYPFTPNYSVDAVAIGKTLVNADSTNLVTVYDNSAGGHSVRIEALNLCSDDTSTVNIQFYRTVSGTDYLIGTVRAVTLSGTDGAATRINALATIGTIAPDGIVVLELPAGGLLKAKSLVAVTAAKTVTIGGWGRTYT